MNTAPKKATAYSAILTTFNAQNTVKNAVTSILDQSVPAREIIIIDDCSTDGTVQILEDTFSQIANLKIITNKDNSGQSYSRNFAAQLSSSNLLIFFDDDDISHAERAFEHLQMFESGADFSFVSSIKRYSNLYEVLCQNEDRKVTKLDALALLRRLALGQATKTVGEVWIPASTSAIDRSFFLSIGGYDSEMRRLEDAEIVVRAAQIGCYGAWSSKVLVDRASTHSAMKGGAIEMDYEKKFVLKFQNELSKAELRRALKLIEIRRAYFSKRVSRLIFLSFTSPALLVGRQGKLSVFLKRLIHDKRQKK